MSRRSSRRDPVFDQASDSADLPDFVQDLEQVLRRLPPDEGHAVELLMMGLTFEEFVRLCGSGEVMHLHYAFARAFIRLDRVRSNPRFSAYLTQEGFGRMLRRSGYADMFRLWTPKELRWCARHGRWSSKYARGCALCGCGFDPHILEPDLVHTGPHGVGMLSRPNGRPRQYCSAACRQRMYRQRKAGRSLPSEAGAVLDPG